jgi:hypothetical protein
VQQRCQSGAGLVAQGLTGGVASSIEPGEPGGFEAVHGIEIKPVAARQQVRRALAGD